MITVSYADLATIQISCEPGIAHELNDHFTFTVPGYRFMPAYMNGSWDGKIKLFNLMNGELLAGLFQYVKKFAEDRKYPLTIERNALGTPGEVFDIEQSFLDQLYATLNLPYEVRDYQNVAIKHAVTSRRALLICPTGSGKSFIAYILTRFFMGINKGKTLIVVPTTSLVSQLVNDFKDYGFDVDRNVHFIYSGKDKDTNKRVVITTWQSVYKLQKSWFNQFDAVIGDEAHGFKAKSLMSIMNKSSNAKFRIGMTGTLDGTQTHKLVLEGVFGIEKIITKTKDLQEQGVLAEANIYVPLLEHNAATCEAYWKSGGMEFADEVKMLEELDVRNQFVAKLAETCKGNTLVLFRHNAHGKVLYNLIKARVPESRKVYFISGAVDTADREAIRKIVETLEDAIIVASGGTFSTGINIRNLHNIIMAISWKARIKVLQSIGRGLRIADNGMDTTVLDILDSIPHPDGLKKANTILRHGLERLAMYKQEGFPFKVAKVQL
jgi:superfamily II DNA or RNA helicase